jgi:Mg/Co/Ni transporter MgtE
MLAMYMPSVKATRIARVIGQGFAIVLGITGLMLGQIFWILIAFFIYFGAGQEGTGAEIKDILSTLKVRQALTGEHDTVAPHERLSEVVTQALHSSQEDFPVIDSEGKLVGLLTRSNLLGGLHHQGPDVTVDSVMEKEFPTVGPDMDFAKVFQKMNEMGMKAVPVVDNGSLLGMVTLEHLSEVFRLLSATDKPMATGR